MAGARLNLSRARILVIEDNPQSLEILSQILLGVGAGANKRVAATGAEARELLRGEPFDLVLLDDEMPDMDGFDLAIEVRRDQRGLNATAPIVMISGFTPRAKIERARDSGINIVISKPIVPAVLLERVERIARDTRPFVVCDTYVGPDRRFKAGAPPPGVEERRAENQRLLAVPERAMNQDEINSLFD